MSKRSGSLTVYFEDPFWVGVFECFDDDRLSVCKVTFGAEPKDYEIQDFILRNYYSLKFSQSVTEVKKESKKNHKRMQRQVKKQLECVKIGTKSQQALKLQHEQNKQDQNARKKKKKEVDAQRLFELKKQKRLEKHKGH